MEKNRPRKILTLCLIHKDGKVLLGMKKRGFGAGRWNGFGGKIEEGETIEESARRELSEEAGIKALKMVEKGIMDFEFENDPKILETHLFDITEYEGEPRETEEMQPRWFDFDEIPYEQMWSDDKFWMPFFLAGKKFKGKFLFDQPSTKEYQSKIISQELCEVDNLG